MDWLSQSMGKKLQQEWQSIVDKASNQARILFRSGAFQVEYLDELLVMYRGEEQLLENLLTYNTKLADQLHPQDRVQTYGSFYIADLAAS